MTEQETLLNQFREALGLIEYVTVELVNGCGDVVATLKHVYTMDDIREYLRSTDRAT